MSLDSMFAIPDAEDLQTMAWEDRTDFLLDWAEEAFAGAGKRVIAVGVIQNGHTTMRFLDEEHPWASATR